MAPDRIASWKLAVTTFEHAQAMQRDHCVANEAVILREEETRIRLARADMFSELLPHHPLPQESYAKIYADWEMATENLNVVMQEVNDVVGVALRKVQSTWYDLTIQEQHECKSATDL
jgi:hypothetical protein